MIVHFPFIMLNISIKENWSICYVGEQSKANSAAVSTVASSGFQWQPYVKSVEMLSMGGH